MLISNLIALKLQRNPKSLTRVSSKEGNLQFLTKGKIFRGLDLNREVAFQVVEGEEGAHKSQVSILCYRCSRRREEAEDLLGEEAILQVELEEASTQAVVVVVPCIIIIRIIKTC